MRTAAPLILGDENSAYGVAQIGSMSGRPVHFPDGIMDSQALLLPKWRAALAKVRRGTQNAQVAFVGDSTTRGQGSGTTTAQALNGFPVQVADILNSKGITAGTQNLFGTGNATLSSFDSRVTLTGTFTTSSVSVGALLYRMAAAATLAFTPTVSFDTIDVWSVNNGTGQFTVNVDGGATAATINTTTAGNIVKTTVSVAAGTHTVNAVWVSGSTYVLGFDCYTAATKQVSCWNMGWLSATAASWAQNAALFNPPGALQNYLQPDLTIINIGINDWVARTNMDTFKANMQTLISAAKVNGDVILCTPVPSAVSVTDLPFQQRYVYGLYDLAQSNGIPVLDLWTRIGSYETMNPLGFYTDTKHPTAVGYSDVATAIVRALGVY